MRLGIGRHPSPNEGPILVAAGFTTFVSLIGEYATAHLLAKEYPQTLKSGDVLHFPIRDYSVPTLPALLRLLVELHRRLRMGHRVFVHCRGGLGRTGTVVIPLVARMYSMPLLAARHLVQDATSQRGCNGGQLFEMPETEEQWHLVEDVMKLWAQ